MKDRIVIGIGIDRTSKTIEIFDKYNIEHTEAYLEIAKQLTNLLSPKELNEFKIKLKDCSFENIIAFADKNQEDIAATMGMSKEEMEDELNEDLDLESRFTYHKPTVAQQQKYPVLRNMAKELAYKIKELCPNGREQSLALTKLEEVIMWANAGISRGE